MSKKSAVHLRDTMLSTVAALGKETARFRCQWIISDYEKVKESVEMNEYIESTDSFSALHETVSLRLKMYPKGNLRTSYKKTGLYLMNIGPMASVWVICKFYFLNSNRKRKCNVSPKLTSILLHSGAGYDFDLPPEECSSLLNNGNLQIRCEGTVWKSEPRIKNDVALQLLNNHSISSLDELYYTDSKPPKDAKVTVAGRTCFDVHKKILCSQSDVFQKHFQVYNHSSLTLPNVSADVFREVLCFLYTNTVTANIDTMLPEVLKHAQKYKLSYLQEICETKIIKNLSIENAVDYYRFAREINAVELKEKCMDFIINNGSDISKHDSFQKFKSEYPDLGELLERVLISNSKVVTM